MEQGTAVFASPTASAPWAIVRGDDSVQMIVHDSWVELVEVTGIEAPGRMWVHRDHVRTGISRARGLVLVEDRQGQSVSVRVDDGHPASRAYEVGFRTGDVIDTINWNPASEISDEGVQRIRYKMNIYSLLSMTVLRGSERVELIDECRVTQQFEFDVSGQRPPCCPM